jgi:FkbM family methyltransferase
MVSKTDSGSDWFISYAQHAEDIMLYRALRHVSQGFYIDIGAHDPDFFSVTKAFYDRGWHGINVEPEAKCYERLLEHRVRDTNLRVLAGEEEGSADFFEVESTGLSTLDEQLAAEYTARGYRVGKVSLPRKTLEAICEESGRTEVHFLKIDVEGAEELVLRGASFTKYRPWIVVAESTKPLTGERSDRFMTEYLGNRGYKQVFFDGVNSFYLADEHRALAQFFDRPPNPFDHYTTPRELELAMRRWEVASMRNSWSWKLTAPLRACDEMAKRLVSKVPGRTPDASES